MVRRNVKSKFSPSQRLISKVRPIKSWHFKKQEQVVTSPDLAVYSERGCNVIEGISSPKHTEVLDKS